MRPCELNQRLAQDAEGVCRLLLPEGKRVGREWKCGDTSGAAGNSMGVCLEGEKAGAWSDFSTGETGDLIGLYKAVKRCTLKDATVWAHGYLGIHDDKFDAVPAVPRYRPIEKPKATTVAGSALAWLRARGFSDATLKSYRITNEGSVINLPYYLDDGKVYHVKYKDISKPPKESWRSSANSTPILFGWQAIPEDCREVIITEGEWDALSYAERGIPALSIPSGAGHGDKLKWVELDWERLERFDTIFLSYDMDDAGQAALPHVIARLGHYRCRVIDLPRKDANEVLQAGLELEDFKKLAKYCDPPELRSMESFAPEVMRLFDGAEDNKGDPLPWMKTRTMYRMRAGELTIWHGFSGHGKSMVLSMVLSYLVGRGSKVCVASMELPAAKLLRRMYQQIGACDCPSQEYFDRITQYIVGKGWLVNIKGTAKASRVLELLDYAYRRYGVTHYVIDSLCKCGFAEDDYNGQKHFIDQLTDFTTDKPVHVHLVAHDRKDNNEILVPGKLDVRGTSGITDMADNVIAVWRNKPKEEHPEKHSHEPDCLLRVQKQRHFDWEGKIGLWYNVLTHQYLESNEDRPSPMIEDPRQGVTDETNV